MSVSLCFDSDDETHMKMACGDSKALPKVTILDPILTLSQPQRVTACTGIDALAHALESAVCTKSNPGSSRHSSEAFKLIEGNLQQYFQTLKILKPVEICYWVRRMLGQQLKEVCLVPHILWQTLNRKQGGRAWDCSWFIFADCYGL